MFLVDSESLYHANDVLVQARTPNVGPGHPLVFPTPTCPAWSNCWTLDQLLCGVATLETAEPCSRLSSAALCCRTAAPTPPPRDTAFTTWDRTGSLLVACDTKDL
ncbi:hypothetical protein MTO96_043319 [Rhipicephalus appendiculatus]